MLHLCVWHQLNQHIHHLQRTECAIPNKQHYHIAAHTASVVVAPPSLFSEAAATTYTPPCGSSSTSSYTPCAHHHHRPRSCMRAPLVAFHGHSRAIRAAVLSSQRPQGAAPRALQLYVVGPGVWGLECAQASRCHTSGSNSANNSEVRYYCYYSGDCVLELNNSNLELLFAISLLFTSYCYYWGYYWP